MVSQYRPSLAKNVIRRSLRAVIDPHPSRQEIELLWQHFDSKCAYCDRVLRRGTKDAHIDHLDGGAVNHISNRVLACADCNEKEKRDLPWRGFLRRKASAKEIYRERELRIVRWTKLMRSLQRQIDDQVQRWVEAEIEAVTTRYDAALTRIRNLKEQMMKAISPPAPSRRTC